MHGCNQNQGHGEHMASNSTAPTNPRQISSSLNNPRSQGGVSVQVWNRTIAACRCVGRGGQKINFFLGHLNSPHFKHRYDKCGSEGASGTCVNAPPLKPMDVMLTSGKGHVAVHLCWANIQTWCGLWLHHPCANPRAH